MIYLIGGPPKCGKTTLAKKLAYEFRFSWISADTLQNIVRAYVSQEKHPILFPHSHSRRGKGNDEFYSEYSPRHIIENYIAQGKTTYDAISMIVETYLTDEDDFIVEGYQVTPEIGDCVLKKFGSDSIRVVFLVRHDAKELLQDIHKSTTPNDWILRKTKDESTFGKITEMIVEYSRYFEEESKKYGFRVFNMDEDFEKQLENIEEYLKLFSERNEKMP
jgi:2-phosphoglycerate kinase